jgi:predicted RNase H-like HicB family nuclease
MPMRKVKITEINVKIAVERDGDKFHAYAPALKGLHVDGTTKKEAIQNAERAIDIYLESLYRENEELPVGPYLTIKYEPISHTLPSARLRNVTVKWPMQRMSGIS